MKKNIKGFYTLEAAIFLPIVILAIISLGYFIKIESLWENSFHGAVDESTVVAGKASNGVEPLKTASKVKSRIEKDNPGLDSIAIKDIRIMYSDFSEDSLISYRIEATELMKLPLLPEREFEFTGKVKFRGFVGIKNSGEPLGAEGLEKEELKQTVWIFPQAGEKYHRENCSYVKASVRPVILSDSVRIQHDSCGLCESDKLVSGDIVLCFSGENTAYHRGTCRSINRRYITVDKTEAERRGYSPCSKCGG